MTVNNIMLPLETLKILLSCIFMENVILYWCILYSGAFRFSFQYMLSDCAACAVLELTNLNARFRSCKSFRIWHWQDRKQKYRQVQSGGI